MLYILHSLAQKQILAVPHYKICDNFTYSSDTIICIMSCFLKCFNMILMWHVIWSMIDFKSIIISNWKMGWDLFSLNFIVEWKSFWLKFPLANFETALTKRVKYLELLILLSFDWTRGNSVAITLWVLRLTFGKHDYKDWDKNFVKPQEGIELISKRPAILDLCERDMSWMYNFRVGRGCARLSNWLPGCLQSLSLLEACVILRVL